MDRLQALLIDVRVNLRRRNIGVSEHFLNDAEIGAVAEQVSRETVAKEVRIYIRFQTRVLRARLYDLPDTRRR